MIIPNEKAFIPQKLVAETADKFSMLGYYGASITVDGIPMNFYWGSKTKTYSKRRKWNKKMRYVLNKGSDIKAKQNMTLSSQSHG